MSRLLYQAELHRQDDRAARSDDRTGWSVPVFPSPFTESNRRPSPYHGDALPTELKGRARRAVGDSTSLLAVDHEGGGASPQARTNSRRCVAPGPAERTPVRASS